MTGIVEMFTAFSEPDEFEVGYQYELFGWKRRKAHREWMRSWYRLNSKAVNANRRSYWRSYREQKRRAAGVAPMKRLTPDERRKYRREWMARKRAEERAA